MARRRIRPLLPHLPPIATVEPVEFTRREIAEMFGGIDPSTISKNASAIGLPEYVPLSKADVWALYVMACYQRVNPGSSRQSYIDLYNAKGEAAVLAYVALAGGSKEDCEQLIESFLAKKRTKPLIV